MDGPYSPGLPPLPCKARVFDWLETGLSFYVPGSRVNYYTGKRRDNFRTFAPGSSRTLRRYQILLHGTEPGISTPMQSYLDRQYQRGTSVHFSVASNGDVYQFGSPYDKAHHSHLCSETAIGIECCSPTPDESVPHSVEYLQGVSRITTPLPDVQVIAVAQVASSMWQWMRSFNQHLPPAPKFPRDGDVLIKRWIRWALHHVGLLTHYHSSNRAIDPLGFNYLLCEETVEQLSGK